MLPKKTLSKKAVDKLFEKYGKIDVLYNNVGLTNLQKDVDVVNMDLEEWDRLMNVNTKSVLLGSRYAIPHMIKAGGGSIIKYCIYGCFCRRCNPFSLWSIKGCSSKSYSLYRCTVWKNNIRCNSVAPGLILTPAAKNNMPEPVLSIFEKYNALPYHGEADDIGYTVLFLASDESKFITGQTIQVEGGHYMANPSIADFQRYRLINC